MMMVFIKEWWGSLKPDKRHKFWVSEELESNFMIKVMIFYAMRYTTLRANCMLSDVTNIEKAQEIFNIEEMRLRGLEKAHTHNTDRSNIDLFDTFAILNNCDEAVYVELKAICESKELNQQLFKENKSAYRLGILKSNKKILEEIVRKTDTDLHEHAHERGKSYQGHVDDNNMSVVKSIYTEKSLVGGTKVLSNNNKSPLKIN